MPIQESVIELDHYRRAKQETCPQQYGHIDGVDRSKELIWGHDFENRNIAATVFSSGARSWGDLSQFSEIYLSKLGLAGTDLSKIKSLLGLRNLILSPEIVRIEDVS